MEALAEKAAFIKQSLFKSQTITDTMVSVLGSFDNRLSVLETAMRPTQIRTLSIRRAEDNIDKVLKQSEAILYRLDLSHQAEVSILKGPHENLESYLKAIDQLKSNVKFFSNTSRFKTNNAAQSSANNLLAEGIAKLGDEFKNLLVLYSKPAEPDNLYGCLPKSLRPCSSSHGNKEKINGKSSSSTDHKESENIVCKPLTLIPPHAVQLLHRMTYHLAGAGYQEQLTKTYREVRSATLELSLNKLGMEALTDNDLQKIPWEILEGKIGNWIQYIRIAVKLLFPSEKKVADQIFPGIESISTLCFAEVVSNSIEIMFNFGDTISKCKRSPEKLFVLLDMYETMRELLPEIESTFSDTQCTGVRESAAALTKRLAQTAQQTFYEFEVAVEKDATKSPVSDGTVHPLTSYVINYTKFFIDYQSTLKLLLQDCGSPDAEAQLSSVTTHIVQSLLNNLDGKSKLYKDPALMELFLMNNVHYIVSSVRRSDMNELLGDDWVHIHRRTVQQHANQYKRVAWSKILQHITVSGELTKARIRERFKNFNSEFEELHQRQSEWSVPDGELRESLRLAIAEVLLPAYRSFTNRFRSSVDGGKYPNKYIKYTPEDLEHKLSDLFEGRIFVEQRR
ncbi:uncharacterized protein [Phyllobates terribilis]|uniref:uncharacterized protein n=1 Tax=Phyllobates terribilis TaxID=111132 RepID=UPI003CCACF3D